MPVSQTQSGKSYEYACLLALIRAVSPFRPITIEQNSSVDIARDYYNAYPVDYRAQLDSSADMGIQTIMLLEPKLSEQTKTPLCVTLQPDSSGEIGDVRDVVVYCPQTNWSIGLSVKNNHHDVKHPRLSPTIDFGKQWLGLQCSSEYMRAIGTLFDRLDPYIAKKALWSDVENKEELIYVPALQLFKDEMLRLNTQYPRQVPKLLMEYLIGRNDFYKVISSTSRHLTVVQAFNIHQTLNIKSATDKPKISVPETTLPDTIYYFDQRITADENASKTTLQMVLNEDWAVSFRLHSAKSNVEKSMKFAIQFTGVPASLFVSYNNWNI